MIKVSNLNVSKSGKQILTDINLSIEQGETICFLGKNGSGKTSLLKSIVGISKLDQGNSFFEDTDLTSSSRSKVISQMGIMIYNDAFYDFLTGKDNIQIVRNFYKKPYFSTDELIRLFELEGVADQAVKKYSAGYKQRLALAMSVVNCPKLVVWDEPFNSIDTNYIKSVINIIQYFQKTWNTTFLITSHIIDGLEAIFSRLILIKDSSISLDIQTKDLTKYWLFVIRDLVSIDEIPHGKLHFKNESGTNVKILSYLDCDDFCYKNNLSKEKVIIAKILETKDIYDFI